MLPLFLALAPFASAADCDAKALANQVDTASPVALPALYEKLASCDPERAKALTPKVFSRMLGGNEGSAAALQAIEIGAGDAARAWIASLEADQRSRAVVWLGEKCAESEPVQAFFLAAYQDKGADFFAERWHRGLTECRVEGVREALTDAIHDQEIARDRVLLFSVLEVYARNLRGEALPALIELAAETTDGEELTYLVNAFADTAGIGSVEGMDPEIARQAAAGVVSLGPSLPPRAVEQARTTLINLGADEAADHFATHRWRDRKDESGNYRYAVAITEVVTCKNGKMMAALHLGAFGDPGTQWPKQIEDGLLDKLTYEWEIDDASKCKGTAEISMDVTSEPLLSEEDQDAWLDKRLRDFKKTVSQYKKARSVRHDPFVY